MQDILSKLEASNDPKKELKEFINSGGTIYDLLDYIDRYEDVIKSAVSDNNRDLLELIICSNLFRQNPPTGESISALISKERNRELMQMAVDSGLDINMNSGDALIEVVSDEDFEFAQFLIDLGADIRCSGDYISYWVFDNKSNAGAKFLSNNGIDLSKSGIDLDKDQDLEKVEYLAWAQEHEDFNQVVNSLFGKLTPRLTRDLYNRIYEGGDENPNTKLVSFFKILKEIDPEFNNDIILNIEFKKWNFDYRSFPIEETKAVLSFYKEKRVIALLQNELSEREFTIDAARTLETIRKSYDQEGKRIVTEEDIKQSLPKKPKSIKEVHDALSILTRKIEQADYALAQNSTMPLDGLKIDGSSLFVPKSSHDLIGVGDDMNICVGNGWYAERARDGLIDIVIVQKSGKNVACIEIANGSISQAKMHNNKQYSDSRVKKFIIDKIKELS